MPPPEGKSVLLIDDSQAHAFFIERALRKTHPGIAVHHLSDGESAVAHLDECNGRRPLPDLVLLDRAMPGGIDGFETLLVLRKRAHLARVAVLILTGSDDPEHVERAQQVGADGYVVKPPDQPGYIHLARQIDEWTPARSWRAKEIVRVACEPVVLIVSQPVAAALPSESMSHLLALPDPVAIVAASPLINKEPFHVMMACNQVGIDLALLTDMRCQEDAVNAKRKGFARLMLRAEYAVRQIQRYVPYSEGWYEKRRAENRKS